ncbi:MAG: peptidase S41, partial [Runella sp.]
KNDPKLQYRTSSGRVVYGGGGITPDVFVPRDTSLMTPYLYELFGKNIMRDYALRYVSQNKKQLEKMSFSEFLKNFKVSEADFKSLIANATADDIKFDEKQFNRSKPYIGTYLKAMIGRYQYQDRSKGGLNNEFYQIMASLDEAIQKSLGLFDKAEELAKASVSLKDSKK